MTLLNRRTFLAAGAAIPFSSWLQQSLAAPPTGKYVRHDARSTQGQAMLAIYADAVGKMKADPSSSRSWTFQWYTHWVNGPQSPYAAALKAKNDAIAALYPGNSPNPTRDLAGEMWSNCEAHGQRDHPPGGAGFPPQDEDFFLPWHRLYVMYFEQIIRAVSGKADFALPYWNYSTSDRRSAGSSSQFARPKDPTFAPLYVQNRNEGVNQGVSIEQVALEMGITNALNLDALNQQDYGFISNSVQGFNQTLDFGLHGNVHVAVGDDTNMGAVPTAAGDPIFWLHHCNIDRLWESLEQGGPHQSSARPGIHLRRRRGQPGGRQPLPSPQLGGTQLHLRPVRGCPRPGGTSHACGGIRPPARREAPGGHGAHRAGPGRGAGALGAEGDGGRGPRALEAHAEGLAADGRMYLVVRNLDTDRQPGTLYGVYLDLPANATPAQKREHAIGAINFFHAHSGHDMPAGGHEAMDSNHAIAASFDITNLVQSLRKAGTLGEKPAVTIVPIGKPSERAKPVVGDISIVEI